MPPENLTATVSVPQRPRWWLIGVVGAVVATLGLSVGAGYLALNSPIAESKLTVTMYLADSSTAEFFYSDEFGNLSAENSLAFPVIRGANTLQIPVTPSSIRDSFSQRLDPCECETPVLVSRMLLTSPVLTEEIPPETWVLGGDVESLTNQGSAVLLRSSPAGMDPQIGLFLDLRDFADRAENRAFWAGFLGAFLILGILLWGGVAWARGKQLDTSLRSHPTGRRERAARVPLWLTVVASAVLVAGIVQQFVAAWVTGATVDEPLHVRHLENFFQTGTYSSSVYGPVTALLGHAANVVVGFEQWGAPVATAEAYAVRHVVFAFIGLAGLAAVFLIGRVVMKSWQWGLFSAA